MHVYSHDCFSFLCFVCDCFCQVQDVLKANSYVAVRVLKDSIESQQFSQLCILRVVRVVRVVRVGRVVRG